ncbi:MAG TPA: hypothetical protein DCE41_28890 [Cytophagales bacterium]|nr:hypothetical protein [Cytophagales bacterium]HAA19721.1 hypothetical protein [Cytophagales bacterium]HAP61617.1 hypothetical protein [Cytophagales bacterium]
MQEFETPNALGSVASFHKTFQHPVLDKPQIPSPDRSSLRVSLLAEELRELQEAIADNDLTEVADALCDLQYVLAGAILEFGMGNQFQALFDEVHRSNMSKACNTEAEAKETIAHYEQQGTPCYFEEKEGKFLVYRTSDGKTLKSIGYSPAQLRELL